MNRNQINRVVVIYLSITVVCVFLEKNIPNWTLYAWIILGTYLALFLLICLLRTKCKEREWITCCYNAITKPVIWIGDQVFEKDAIKKPLWTGVVMLIVMLIFILLVFFAAEVGSSGKYVGESLVFIYIVLSCLPIILTLPYVADCFNYHLHPLFNAIVYYPEIIRRFIFAGYFALIVIFTVSQLLNMSSCSSSSKLILWEHVFAPAFLTFIAYDRAFYEKYVPDLDRIQRRHKVDE